MHLYAQLYDKVSQLLSQKAKQGLKFTTNTFPQFINNKIGTEKQLTKYCVLIF